MDHFPAAAFTHLPQAAFTLNSGNTAWILVSAALVLMMTVPALAFFYGGLSRGTSVLNMMVMNFAAAGVVGVLWMIYGYSMAFGTASRGVGVISGNPLQWLGLDSLTDSQGLGAAGGTGVPALVGVVFQATFAVITVALIAGAIADRMKFGSWIVFAGVWATAVYFPMAHMVWGGGLLSPGGWVSRHIATPIDFAGGTVVHINAGVAAFILIMLLGKRVGWPREPMRPHNVPFVMLGAGLLWVGWFGFNAGSEGAADGVAGRAWANTFLAACAAMVAWMATERVRDGHSTAVGSASGVVAGLVAITPAAAAVDTWGALAIGVVVGVVCCLTVALKFRIGYDDALDVIGVHLVGGVIGCLMLGLFAHPGHASAWAPAGARNGLFYGGGLSQLLSQAMSVGVVLVFSGVLTFVIAFIMKKVNGIRFDGDVESGHIDLLVHGESAYESITAGRFGVGRPGARISTSTREALS